MLSGYFEDSHHYEVSVSAINLVTMENHFVISPQAANLTVQLFTVPSLVGEHVICSVVLVFSLTCSVICWLMSITY